MAAAKTIMPSQRIARIAKIGSVILFTSLSGSGLYAFESVVYKPSLISHQS